MRHVSGNSKSGSTLPYLNTPHEANLGQIMHDTDNLGPITHYGKPFCHPYLLSFFIPTTGHLKAKLSQHPGIFGNKILMPGGLPWGRMGTAGID